ncbi:MAG: thiol reductant ABC exporter subunit CydD [Caldibacillus debilis]|jgi:ATP-binding cassette subfamily C protein CydD|uniref:Thiol reductant ABC exporter subunit CydD n=1 Tax=Caldibacillus debilis TaxID=301148 RepID=A0A3E0K5F3_9BACI|nr:thiol reductant ABC exporter subunit CydD [Caldibacillus debilis]MBO2482596.1 thiol reductant ABC exporter subunit CydD [Bacillaceae bacterium]REJ28564.1 MAG: thiol reductant ABC exporter subunit CydD [Caldibacillus debilis]
MDRTLFSFKGLKPVLAGLAALTAIQAAAIIVQAYFLADAISSLFGGDPFAHVFHQWMIFLFALVLRQLLAVWKRTIAYRFAARTGKELREALLQKLFQLGPRFVRAEGSGQTVTLVMEGIAKFRRYLELLLPKMMNSVIIPSAIFLFILFVNIRSAVILGLAVPILIVFMILLGLAAKIKADRQYKSYQMLSNHFVDSLRGLETLKYLGLSRRHINSILFVSERYRRATMGTLRIAFLSSFAMDFFTMLSIATVAVFLGMDLINGKMGLHPALTILILAPEYFLPIRELGADYHATLDGKEAGKKIREILDKETPQQGQDPIPPWNAASVFSVKGLSVRFADSRRPALQDIRFSVSGFQKVGIIGASGAGKSTLIDVLGGFLTPSAGEFEVNGRKVTTLSQRHWQSQITYIPQHPYLFHDTVFNNIRFYRPEAAREEVEEAAERAGLTGLIRSLPEGFETIIGEGGRALSGGQEQRIALARAFLSDRPIIMLDEPTAHLDVETEYELKETMRQLFKGKLVFFATHRLHWMPDMDFIIVLDQGKIVETGTHEQLIRKKAAYYRLVKRQMEGL